MTLHTVSQTWARCDGTITAACDALHPDTPHPCQDRATWETHCAVLGIALMLWASSRGPR